MKLVNKSCVDFTEELASKNPVPGGGSAAALTGALGAALSSMVCNLTIGKKKFIKYDKELNEILQEAKEIQEKLINMIDMDADNFLPLSKAYGMKKDTEEERKLKDETLEKALKKACEIPVDIVKNAYKAIKLHEKLVNNCSKLAISDVGVGVQCLKAAIISAELNIIINIKSIKDKEYVDKVKNETESLVIDGGEIADRVYAIVLEVLKN
ncbi:cyclodeaminase/cyclohydrolase family protein [Haloimpatiens sp. FM7315]|uniref:cyclodeaminase/cyclohydrolase family protein n=1 Tax=Haloimpatiens sp. FM7315 TaxID=3298609 RepID=UPI0035A39B34